MNTINGNDNQVTRHCEERSDVAILKDEIASPSVRNDREDIFK